MDTNLTLELFIGRGMIDKSLAKDIKEEMIASGKELPEVLADFGIIGSKDDIWQMIAATWVRNSLHWTTSSRTRTCRT